MKQLREIAVVGCGAAGLFASIWAARTLRSAGSVSRVVALDGARTLGAKILVSGGGRCNVTHHHVDESAYAGASRNAIKNVLRGFNVARTIAFFAELGVELKREDTGKLFPTTDSARSVLSALLNAAQSAGVEILHPWRVASVSRTPEGFVIQRDSGDEQLVAHRLILATGGKALPKSGSDGAGYTLATALGHTITPEVFPALVPLVLDPQRTPLTQLSGLTLPATLELWSGTGKRLTSFTNSTLCTHFGLSGPAVLDVSRYYTAAKHQDPGAALTINFVPAFTPELADAWLAEPARAKASVVRTLSEHISDRLARVLCTGTDIEPGATLGSLTREQRRALARALTRCPLPVTSDRGFTYAETTAGGVPLSELHLSTMESRPCPGLHVCGEICDVDGRIGGFNFQWAWASGHAAGVGAGTALTAASPPVPPR